MENSISSTKLSKEPTVTESNLKSHLQPFTILPGIDVKTIVINFYLDQFRNSNDQDRQNYLDKVNCIGLLEALAYVKAELASVRLESFVLRSFLQKNDSKLLIGLDERQLIKAKVIGKHQMSGGTSGDSGIHSSKQSSSKRSRDSLSQFLRIAEEKRSNLDFGLNFKAKSELTEKCISDMQKVLSRFETTFLHNTKNQCAVIDGLKYCSEETIQTMKNFRLHFFRDDQDVEFLKTGTERQVERKFRKFVQNWLKNAKSLISSMHLTITLLHEKCFQFRGDFLTKVYLSRIITASDFEKLMLKGDEHSKSLEVSQLNITRLKAIKGRASLSLSAQKNIMMSLEQQLKKVVDKSIEVQHTIKRLSTLVGKIRLINEKEKKSMDRLKMKLVTLNAPNIYDYIEKKEEWITLDKEQKILLRKNSILQVTLQNLYVKQRAIKNTPTF